MFDVNCHHLTIKAKRYNKTLPALGVGEPKLRKIECLLLARSFDYRVNVALRNNLPAAICPPIEKKLSQARKVPRRRVNAAVA